MQHFSMFGNKMLSENFTMKYALFQGPSCIFCFGFVPFVCFVENSHQLWAGYRIKVTLPVTDFSNEFSIHKKKFLSSYSCILWERLIFLGEYRWREKKICVIFLLAVPHPLPPLMYMMLKWWLVKRNESSSLLKAENKKQLQEKSPPEKGNELILTSLWVRVSL